MPRLSCQSQMKEVLAKYFGSLTSPLAWCTSAGPAEILRALGFQVYFPENHGAMLGSSRLAQKYIPEANKVGYSNEVCSYLTSDIGAWLVKETPLAEAYGLSSIPKPDLIVFSTNQCREVAEWFNYYGREFACPVFGIFPPRYLEEVTSDHLENVAAQFRGLIEVGEQVIGRKLDPARLRETVDLSREGTLLWNQVLATAKQHPAPLTFFDATILMAPIVMLRGTCECVSFYKSVLAELRILSARGEGAVPRESTRLYWEGMPIWGRLRSLSDLFTENQAAVVASTYCNSWIFNQLDPDRPLVSLARAYTEIFINRGEGAKFAYLKRMLADFDVNGIIFHDAKTCFNNTNNRFALPFRLQEETGVSTLTVDGDLNDLRFFSDGRTRTKIETFVAQLAT